MFFPFRATAHHPDFEYLIRLAVQYIALIALSMGHDLRKRHSPIVLTAVHHPALLYYDYALTFDRERRLFWSQRSSKQWGSVLFFLNRYCGVIGNAPVFIQKFAQHNSALYFHCKLMRSYHQILAVIMQTIIGRTSRSIDNKSFAKA